MVEKISPPGYPATAEFDYIDKRLGQNANQKLLEQPAIYGLDVSKQVTLEHRINTAI